MSSRFPMQTLILPLLVATLICLGVSLFISSKFSDWAEAVLQGLAATFIAILIAVIYVEEMQSAHERRQWRVVETHVNRRARQIARRVYKASHRLSSDVYAKQDPQSAEMIRSLKAPPEELAGVLEAADQQSFGAFDVQIQGVTEKVEQLLDVYGRFLPASLFAVLLDLSNDAVSYSFAYEYHTLRNANAPAGPGELKDLAALIKRMMATADEILAETPDPDSDSEKYMRESLKRGEFHNPFFEERSDVSDMSASGEMKPK